MGVIQKLKKLIDKNQPMIVFFPNSKIHYDVVTNGIIDKIRSLDIEVITVTDPKIYSRILEGIEQAEATNQHNVERP